MRRSREEIFSAIRGDPAYTTGEYVEFITQDWRNKRITNISTSPSATTNYFQAGHNHLPFELSPAFFNPEVLLRYKGDREKYTIEERNIICRDVWILRDYDINEAGQVHAYICDLRKLPHQEQLYWKSFNEMPRASISERALTNDFRAEWVRISDPLSEVKTLLLQWSERDVRWWKLRDQRLVNRVSVPRTHSRDEWAGSFKDLSKLIIEGFHIKGIRVELKGKGITWTKEEKTLALVERVLSEHAKGKPGRKLDGLRLAQLIRSKVDAHVGGDDAEALSSEALQKHGTYALHFAHVCEVVVGELRIIEEAFCGGPDTG